MKLQKFPSPCPMAGDNVPADSLKAGVVSKYTRILSFGKDNTARSQRHPR